MVITNPVPVQPGTMAVIDRPAGNISAGSSGSVSEAARRLFYGSQLESQRDQSTLATMGDSSASTEALGSSGQENRGPVTRGPRSFHLWFYPGESISLTMTRSETNANQLRMEFMSTGLGSVEASPAQGNDSIYLSSGGSSAHEHQYESPTQAVGLPVAESDPSGIPLPRTSTVRQAMTSQVGLGQQVPQMSAAQAGRVPLREIPVGEAHAVRQRRGQSIGAPMASPSLPPPPPSAFQRGNTQGSLRRGDNQ